MPADPASSRRVSPLPAGLAGALGPLLAGLLVLTLALAALAIAASHQHRQERAVAATQNLARLAEAQLSDSFDAIDLYLQLLAARQAAGAGGAVLPAPPPAGVGTVAIADAAGRVRLRANPSQPLPAGMDERIAEQAFFRRAVADPRAGLVVSGPVRAAPDGPAQVVFARAARDAAGQLLGVVFAAVGAAQFDRLFWGIDLGPHGAAALRTDDLQPLYHYPAWDEAQGAAAPEASAAWRQALAAAPLEGTYEPPADAEGHDRVAVYRRLRTHPFYLVVAQSADEAGSAWAGGALVLAGLVAALAPWVWLARRRAVRRQLQALRNSLGTIADNASDGIVGMTLRGSISAWNHGAERMFGYGAAEILGRPAAVLAPPERCDEDAALIARVLRGERVQAFETVRRRKDGVPVNLSLAMSPVLDARGRVVGVTGIARDLGRRHALEAESRSTTFDDPLTLLPNRRLLLDRLRQAQLSSSRQRSYYGVLFIDLDGFRQINESLGRAAGDQLLVEIAHRLQAAVRQHDTVARFGGDEFVVLLEDLGSHETTAADHVNTVADKLLDAIERVVHLGGMPQHCSASIGIRLLIGSHDSPEQVLVDADAAMYRVKCQRRALKSFAFE
ncbi:diguanylate cyclase domain-containing protein [Pseudorhodoferax sp.]|uniref:diguanylate cyclase domain-containing protein n=1 Tax=Pseudorhodoferax sp. TaxID=1993553 RepID=UPI0039E3C2ED